MPPIDDGEQGAGQHSERALGEIRRRALEGELVHEQRDGEADSAERSNRHQVEDRDRQRSVPAHRRPRDERTAGDADDLAERQGDENGPEHRSERRLGHIGDDDERRREGEQRQDDGIRPRLQCVAHRLALAGCDSARPSATPAMVG